MDDTQKIEAGDSAVVEAEDATEETPEVKVDVPKKDKKPKATKKKVGKKKVTKKKAKATPKKAKPEKPTAGVGKQEKGKGKAKGVDKGLAWWKSMGMKLAKREHSERNIILRASRDAGKTFQQAMTAMRMQATLEEKARSLFTD